MQGTVVASTVTASIQWDQAARYHWVIHGFWYGSLVLSLFSVIVAFHLTILLGTYELGRGHQLIDALKQTVSDKPKFSAMFIFQAPVMLLSYAIISYVVGLSVAVLRPLWTVPWNDEHKVRWHKTKIRRALTFVRKVALLFIGYIVLALGTYLAICVVLYTSYLTKL